MPDDRIQDLIALLRRFTRERRWSRYHDPKNLAMLVASEAGELLHLFRWVPNAEADAFAARPERRREIEAEIADVAISILLLADRLGLDLAEAVRAKIARNAEKYPAGRGLLPAAEPASPPGPAARSRAEPAPAGGAPEAHAVSRGPTPPRPALAERFIRSSRAPRRRS